MAIRREAFRYARARVAYAAAAVALVTACRAKIGEPISRAQSPAVANAHPSSTKESSRCALSVWADLTAARALPGVDAVRQQVLRGLDARTLALAQSSGFDLEQMSREARMCELSARGRTTRALEFRGSFPPDMMDKLAALFPGGGSERDPSGPIRVASGWIGRRDDRLLWSDDRATLEQAFGRELFDPPPRDAKLFSMRMTRERARVVGASGLHDAPDSQWTSVVVSTARDGKSSEIRFDAESVERATTLLSVVREFLDHARSDARFSRILAPARLAAEADDNTVALRAQLPPDQLLQIFTKFEEQRAKHKLPT